MYKKIKNITLLTLSKLGFQGDQKPDIGIILGSGLGGLCDLIQDSVCLPYSEIDGFVDSTVQGHKGQFVSGSLGGKKVVVMQGRAHYYEGYTMDQVTLGVRVMCEMGVKTLIVTNAAGGLNPCFEVGDLMLIDDHINLLPNPLIGANIDQIGPRFVDMSEPYDGPLRDLATKVISDLGLKLNHGVYLASTGPTYETPAEYRFFRTIGADACGMSTTPEVIVARHAGVGVLGFSVITNVLKDSNGRQVENAHDDVVLVARNASSKLIKIIEQCLIRLS